MPPLTRCRQCNIVRGSPGPTPAANAANTMFKGFKMLYDDQFVDTICTFTNVSRVIQDFNAEYEFR